jgi:hypothetical protein
MRYGLNNKNNLVEPGMQWQEMSLREVLPLRKDDEAISACSLVRRGAVRLLRFARNDTRVRQVVVYALPLCEPSCRIMREV